MTSQPTLPHARVAEAIRTTTVRWAGGATLDEIRRDFANLIDGPCPAMVTTTRLAGLATTISTPPEPRPDAAILYCHGGGFQIGSPEAHHSLIGRLAAAAGIAAWAPAYRLAPEHRFPVAHQDCFAAYRELLARGFNPAKIAIAGDSAGGNLAVGVALQARAAAMPLPAALVLISPFLDLTLRGDSYTSRAALDLFSRPEQIRAMARTYLGRGGDPLDPLASPVEAGLAGLPPVLIHAGDRDVTLDDSTLFAARAQAAGVACTVKVWPEMYHHFQAFADLPEAGASLSEIGDWLRQCCG